jgi:hypothetical protein
VPIYHRFMAEERLVVFVHIGRVTDEELLTTYKTIYSDPRMDVSFDKLVDLRRTDSTPRSSDALRALVEIVGVKTQENEVRPKVAVIAPGNLSYGMSRVYEAFSIDASDETVAVFREADAALAWLRAPDNALDDFPFMEP